MTQPASRRRAWPALLLTGALLLSGSLSGVALAQNDKAKGKNKAEPTPVVSPSPTPTPKPTPEPTPYPQFDPDTVTLRLDLLTDSLDDLVYVTDDGLPGKRCLYAVEKGGKVWLIDSRDGFRIQKPFLDLSGKVATGPEQGLHSIAFHPGFAKNGRFFARWDNPAGKAVVAEFKGAPCKPAPAKGGSKIVKGGTWVVEDQDYPNNNGGWIGFGPDDKLYVALGDGGGPRPGDPDKLGQNPGTALAKILRIDVDQKGGIARDNPYVKVNRKAKITARGDFNPRTWVRGVRDPRRASFDRETGDFWFGDVGQDQLDRPGWEEVNLVPAGSVKPRGSAPNFGWSHVEGVDTCHPVNGVDCDPTAYTPPVFAYEKTTPHRAITGGYVYRGQDIEELDGVYLFSDYASGVIWGLDADAVRDGVEVTAHELYDAPQGFVSFGEDDRGELYLVALGGSIYRLTVEAS